MSDAVVPAAPKAERRILRRREVEQKTGFKRAHLYGLMREGKFPQCIRLGVRAVGWDSLEVEQWILDRLAERNSGSGDASSKDSAASVATDGGSRRTTASKSS